jgi:hypothetical protein
MARKCPNCLVVIPATSVIIYSNDIVCEPCNSPLEISRFSRNVASFAALIVAAIVFKIASSYYSVVSTSLGWVFPVLFAYLAYSIAAPLVLILIADLQMRPFEEPTMPAAHHEHAPAHHSSHSH